MDFDNVLDIAPPNPRHTRGVKNATFRRNHHRFVKEHDKHYVDRHNLAAIVDEAWDKCMMQKPAEPLRYIANLLDPFSERKLVLQLQEEIASLKARHALEATAAAGYSSAAPKPPPRGASPQPPRRRGQGEADPDGNALNTVGTVMVLSDDECAKVNDSFQYLLLHETLAEQLNDEIAARDEHVAARLQGFDDQAADPAQRFLPLLRLATQHLHQPSLIEGFVRGVARKHRTYGIIERDYPIITSAFLTLIRRHLLREVQGRDDLTKRAWVSLHAFISTTMAAGTQCVPLHAKHQTCLAMSLDDVKRVKESMTKIKDKASAAAAVARGIVDMSPRAAKILEDRGMTPTRMGQNLLDAVELVVDMLETRGFEAAMQYLLVLGQRHTGYGVDQSLFPIVGQALLSAAHHSLAKDSETMVDEVCKAWKRAMDAVVGLLLNPLAEGAPLPSVSTMCVSDLRKETEVMVPNLEEDLSELLQGRATPQVSPRAAEQTIRETVGDVSNVPVSDEHLRRLFDRYDVEKSQWLSRDTMIDIVMSQEAFGVPLQRDRVARQIDTILVQSKAGRGQITFHLFSIIMLKMSQR
eukprot:TRINITY_DN4710_c1_g1_i1.p1 TRINITY_DN4710_c1_g1~~TRINITY_DN4710_c1_g1_i1.p1  ORF type:complete len:581 (+),score=248.64 TRINITY_DN4710_c1_g1_i1:82-1824(+)